MKTLVDILTEGVFDLDDNEKNTFAEEAEEIFFSKYCKGNYKIVKRGTKTGIEGRIVISNYKEKYIPIKCDTFKGSIYVDHCDGIESLEGFFFSKMTTFDGDIFINNCKSLKSLNGLPTVIKGSLAVTNCKSLKSINLKDNIGCLVIGTIMITGCGKKFKPEDFTINTITTAEKILCSEEEVEANLTEAFSNPWLQKLGKQLKKNPSWVSSYSGEKEYTTFNDFIRNVNSDMRIFDKIGYDEIEVYDLGRSDDKKNLLKLIYDSYSKRDGEKQYIDMLLIYDVNEDEYVEAYGHTTKLRGSQSDSVVGVKIPTKNYTTTSRSDYYSKTEFRGRVNNYGTGYKAIVILSSNNSETNWRTMSNLHYDRENARKGMINPGDAYQYKEIARKNIARYKDIIAKNRTTKKTGEYQKLCDDVKNIMDRVFKMTTAVMSNPTDYGYYDVEQVMSFVSDKQVYVGYSRSHPSGVTGSNGLMPVFQSYVKLYQQANGATFSKSYGSQDAGASTTKSLENMAESLKKKIEIADERLKKLGF